MQEILDAHLVNQFSVFWLPWEQKTQGMTVNITILDMMPHLGP